MNDFTGKSILAIDTATPTMRLALTFGGDRLVKAEESVGTSHGRLLISKIGNLIQSGNVSKDSLHALVVCIGPGSFTGLRIGLAAAKGIAVALEIPVVGVSLFDVAAYKLRSVSQRVYILAPFKRDEYFVVPVRKGMYDVEQIKAVAASDVPGVVGDCSATGIGINPAEILPQMTGRKLCGQTEYDAADLLRLGVAKLSAGDIDDLSQLQPLYVQRSQAEIRYAQRQKRQ